MTPDTLSVTQLYWR